jgi:hypothetical protein
MRAQVRMNARSDPTISIVALLADDDQRAGAFLDSCLAARADALDLVVVNDGSADGTWRCIAAAKSVDPHFGAVDLAEAYGPSTAMREGARRSEADVVLFVGVGSSRAVETLPELRREFADPDLIAIVGSTGSGGASKPVTIRDAAILQQRLIDVAEGGWGDPVVARRAVIIASIDALVPGTAGRVIGQWFAPGVPVMEPGEAKASVAPRRQDARRPRWVSRRSALLAASILVSAAVFVVSSNVPAPAQGTRFETVTGSLVDRVPESNGASRSVEDPGHRRSPAASTTDTGRSSRTSRGTRSGSAPRTKGSGVGGPGGAGQTSSHGAESSQGGGSPSGGAGGSQGEGDASGGGSAGNGGGGGNGGGDGGGGGTGGGGGGGSPPGNGHGHGHGHGHAYGHAYGHSHSHAGGNGNGNGGGQGNSTPAPAPPKKGQSGDHSGHGRGNS